MRCLMICKDENSLQQLGDVRRDPSRLILAEQLSGRAPAKLRLVWLGGAGPDWLRVMAMVTGPVSATPRTVTLRPILATATRLTAIRLPDTLAPMVDTGRGKPRGTAPPITPLSDAIFPYGPALLVSGVIGSKKPTKVSSSLF